MKSSLKLGRRALLRSSVALGAAAGCASRSDPGPVGAPSPGGPLAQEYAIAARVPDDGRFYFMHDPGMALLPSGRILVASPCWELPARDSAPTQVIAKRTFVTASDDGGRTFQALATLEGESDATPFVVGGRLYMFVRHGDPAAPPIDQFGPFQLRASDDGGATWTEPRTIFEGSYWNTSTSMAIRDGVLYWALNVAGFQGAVVVVMGDTTRDLLNPSAWRMSKPAERPPTPWGLMPGAPPPVTDCAAPKPTNDACPAPQAASCADDWWLEPNAVLVGGRIRVFLRAQLDGQRSPGLAAVCDLDEAASELRFTQLAATPGGQCKCFVIRDDVSGLFWMLSNLPADPHETVLDWKGVRAERRFLGTGGNDRRFLMLSYSLDALSWFPAGCVARASLLRQSFMYPSAAIDGDDLVLIARTSVDGWDQHNADLVTFHRVRRFRDLAMILTPGA